MGMFFGRKTIAAKMTGIMLVTIMLALFIILFGVLLHKYHDDQHSLEQQVKTLGKVIASRSTGALEFGDYPTAKENLNALAASEDIIEARLYLENGELFAAYKKKNRPDQALIFLSRELGVSEIFFVDNDVILDEQVIGKLVLVVSRQKLFASFSQSVLITLIISVFAFVLAFVVFNWLHKSISGPIADLTKAMKKVSENQYDRIRGSEKLDGDLGLLSRGFNNMIRQIELRERQLAEHQRNLQAEIEAQRIEIKESQAQRIFWLETMAGFLKHELQNTTVGIKTSLQLIEKKNNDKAIQVYIERGRKSLYFMNELLSRATEASSMEAAIYKEKFSELDLSALAQDYLNEYRTLYEETILRATIADGVVVQGNAERIRQMLDKLLSNAIDHHLPGTAIEIKLEKSARMAVLTVSNLGENLPQDIVRIFDLFYSHRKGDSKKNGHFGLGLYIVKLIAESHNGSVSAENLEIHSGARFFVNIPLLK